MATDPYVTSNGTTPPRLVPCRGCGNLVRPNRPCWRCGYETPARYADRPDVAALIVNTTWALASRRAA